MFYILPITAIIFQAFFLLISIAIESNSLHREIRLSRKMSVEYALSMNLVAAVLGWILFFYLYKLLSPSIKIQLLEYIFFNRLRPNVGGWIILFAFVIFWLTFFVKVIVLVNLNRLSDPNYPLQEDDPESPLGSSRRKIKKSPERRQALTVLWGHAYSNSTILAILLLKEFLPVR